MKLNLLIGLLTLLCFSWVNAQNPTVIRAGTGISVSPSSGVGVVTVSATGGGGASGAAALTNSPNFWTTASFNTFNGPTLNVGAVTNSSLFIPLCFDSVSRVLVNSTGTSTNDFQNGFLYSGSDATLSVNWNGRTLNRQGGTTVFDYQNVQMNDTSGNPAALFNLRQLRNNAQIQVDWQNDLLANASGNQVDWNVNQLDNNGTPILDWKQHQLLGTWTNTVNFVSSGLINGEVIGLSSNVFGRASTPATTTNIFYGAILANTNKIDVASHYANFTALSSAMAGVNFNIGGGSTSAEIDVGDYYNLAGGGGSQYLRIIAGTSSTLIRQLNDQPFTLGTANRAQITMDTGGEQLTIGDGAPHAFINNSGTSTYGVNSSSTHTFNGSTFTLAHNATVNGGQLIIPVTGTGTLTNNTAIFTPSLVVTNITMVGAGSITMAAPANLISTYNTPVGVTNYIETINGGVGPKQTQARTLLMTNTFSGPYVHQLIYTNTGNSRLFVSVALAMPSGATTISSAGLATISAGITNIMGWRSTSSGVAAVSTNSIEGWVDPGDLYWGTNMTTGAGAPTFVPDRYVQKLF